MSLVSGADPDVACKQCCGADNISFGSAEPQIRIAAPALNTFY